MSLFHAYLYGRTHNREYLVEKKYSLMTTQQEPSFAKLNPFYDNVCQGHRKLCNCGAAHIGSRGIEFTNPGLAALTNNNNNNNYSALFMAASATATPTHGNSDIQTIQSENSNIEQTQTVSKGTSNTQSKKQEISEKQEKAEKSEKSEKSDKQTKQQTQIKKKEQSQTNQS